MNDNGEGVPPVPFRDGRTALALHGSWLREHTHLSFPCRLKPQQAVLQDALFFFHSRHLTWFKICRLLESHVASWEVCQLTASKIYLSPSQKQQRFRKHCSHLICKGILFKDFISSSLSMNGLWAIFQLMYPFYSGLHTNNNRSKEHVFLLLQVLLCCAGNILSSRAVYFFALFSLLACPETSVRLGCLRTWVPP